MNAKRQKKIFRKRISRQLFRYAVICSFTFCSLLSNLYFPPAACAAVRIKDIAQFQGVRDNQLIGYGLVVGLNGTGDKSQSVFTVKSIASLLSRLGIDVRSSEVKPKNVAAVMITATLPPFIKAGSRIDVTLSSVGDATSLQGGTLLLTPLQGADEKVYAVAQGPVSIGGFDPASSGRGGTYGTVARIPNGALIEREVPVNLMTADTVALSLKKIDFTTCVRMAEAINVTFADAIAMPVDGATVEIAVPDAFLANIVGFLAKIEHIEIQPDTRAKIVINERTGTIVGGKDVKISRVSLNHKNINLEIKPQEEPAAEKLDDPERMNGWHSQAEGLFIETDENKKPTTTVSDETTIGEVAQILNSMGVKPMDMITIFQAIKQAGAIQADLEII
jgi:flagellar P-ring protein precursor FlgI